MSFVQPCRIAVSDRAENEGVKVLSTMLFPKTLSEKPETKYRKQKKHIANRSRPRWSGERDVLFGCNAKGKTLFQKAFSRIGFSDLGQHRTNIMQRHSVLGSV